MNVLTELKNRFAAALETLDSPAGRLKPEEVAAMVDLVRQSQDERHGDYQANFAMPLAKRLSMAPHAIASRVLEALDLSDGLGEVEVAGPGFINVRLSNEWLEARLAEALVHERLGVEPTPNPRRIIIDYSAPNVAKPMHVGHIRSTVIGDSLYRMLRFLGHDVTSDNHLGDWGTQFGMIIYGYKHFRNDEAFAADPVGELGRLYRQVHRLVTYHEDIEEVADLDQRISETEKYIEVAENAASEEKLAGKSTDERKKARKGVERLRATLNDLRARREELQRRISECENDPATRVLLRQYPHIHQDVLAETAKLHEGDPENRRLWKEFMGPCLEAIEKVYRRLNIRFDETLGESFYHDRLAEVVNELLEKGIAQESEGAICVFTANKGEAPLVIRKRDGAFLYATTDLATIRYRMERWNPDAILYVVDHRQSQHFQQVFATARAWGYTDVELTHVAFGTVLGDDGRPFKTRSGDLVGLEGLMDEAVRRAEEIVSANDDKLPEPQLSAEERRSIAEKVGLGALKYADLSQNRTTDYVFSYDRMLSMDGNTATYMQYAYARIQSIFRRGEVDVEALRRSAPRIMLTQPAERALGLELLRFEEALLMATADYRPHHLTNYLFGLANRYSTFFETCHVLRAEDEGIRKSRLCLCDLTARTLKLGLDLIGVEVVEKM